VCYADDTQIYGFCDPSHVDALRERLSVCIDKVFLWMTSNWLQLNPSKTGVLWCSSARRQHQIPTGSVRVCDTSVQPIRIVRDLGVYLDADVTMSAHITNYQFIETVIGLCFSAKNSAHRKSIRFWCGQQPSACRSADYRHRYEADVTAILKPSLGCRSRATHYHLFHYSLISETLHCRIDTVQCN